MDDKNEKHMNTLKCTIIALDDRYRGEGVIISARAENEDIPTIRMMHLGKATIEQETHISLLHPEEEKKRDMPATGETQQKNGKPGIMPGGYDRRMERTIELICQEKTIGEIASIQKREPRHIINDMAEIIKKTFNGRLQTKKRQHEDRNENEKDRKQKKTGGINKTLKKIWPQEYFTKPSDSISYTHGKHNSRVYIPIMNEIHTFIKESDGRSWTEITRFIQKKYEYSKASITHILHYMMHAGMVQKTKDDKYSIREKNHSIKEEPALDKDEKTILSVLNDMVSKSVEQIQAELAHKYIFFSTERIVTRLHALHEKGMVMFFKNKDQRLWRMKKEGEK